MKLKYIFAILVVLTFASSVKAGTTVISGDSKKDCPDAHQWRDTKIQTAITELDALGAQNITIEKSAICSTITKPSINVKYNETWVTAEKSNDGIRSLGNARFNHQATKLTLSDVAVSSEKFFESTAVITYSLPTD